MGDFAKAVKARKGRLWSSMFIQTTFRSTEQGEEHVINLEGFGQIIDEMKKEYPVWDNSDIEAKLTADVLLDLVKAKDKWANKWLGEKTTNG